MVIDQFSNNIFLNLEIIIWKYNKEEGFLSKVIMENKCNKSTLDHHL